MKKLIKSLLALGCLTSLILASAESEQFTTQILWSVSWIAAAGLCGVVYGKLFPEDSKE